MAVRSTKVTDTEALGLALDSSDAEVQLLRAENERLRGKEEELRTELVRLRGLIWGEERQVGAYKYTWHTKVCGNCSGHQR